ARVRGRSKGDAPAARLPLDHGIDAKWGGFLAGGPDELVALRKDVLFAGDIPPRKTPPRELDRGDLGVGLRDPNETGKNKRRRDGELLAGHRVAGWGRFGARPGCGTRDREGSS